MDIITRNTDYAIRALIYLAQNKDTIVSTSQLQQEMKLPRPFMRKLCQTLQKTGYIDSIKGNRGGFRLAVSARAITLTDLIRVFQGDVALTHCLFKKRVCPNTKTCPLRKKLKSIEAHMLRELQSVTIASLMQGDMG